MPVSGSNPSAIALFDLIVSYRITAIIHTAAQLGIADALAEGPRTPGELAASTGAHAPSLQRLLRALVAIGICRETGQGEFALTEIGAHIAEGASQSLKAYALFEGDAVFRSWETSWRPCAPARRQRHLLVSTMASTRWVANPRP